MPGQPLAHEHRNRIEIARDCVIGLGIAQRAVRAGQGAAVAGADRIDEDQIGEVDPAVGIGRESRGRGGEAAVPRACHRHRSDRGKMEIDARPARPAVEHEGHWPGGWIGAFQGIGDVEDFGRGALGIGADRHHPGLRLVVGQTTRQHRLHAEPEAQHQPADQAEQRPSCDGTGHHFSPWLMLEHRLRHCPAFHVLSAGTRSTNRPVSRVTEASALPPGTPQSRRCYRPRGRSRTASLSASEPFSLIAPK